MIMLVLLTHQIETKTKQREKHYERIKNCTKRGLPTNGNG